MKELSIQEAFSRMVTHLRAQGEKSATFEGCLYRGPNGTMCAVGCLIPDDEYDPTMENKCVNNIPLFHGWDVYTQSMLEFMQGIHDRSEPDKWEECFHQAASRYNLTMPEKVG